MYWNDDIIYANNTCGSININMRCIEMKEINKSEPTSYRLTLTWDVLK